MVFGGGVLVAAGAAQSVAEGQAGAGLFQYAGVVGLGAAGAERVVEVEVQAIAGQVIGGQQLAARVDVGVLPDQGVVRGGAHLRDLLAAGAEDVVCRRLESVGGRIRIAAPRGDGALGHARAVGVVEVAGAGHDRIAVLVGQSHGADAPLGVVEIAVGVVAGHVARRVVDEIVPRRVDACPCDAVAGIIGRGGRGGRGAGGALYLLRRAVAEAVVGPAEILAGILRSRAGGRGILRRGKPVQGIVAEVPRAHHGISIAGERRVEVRGIPGPQLRGTGATLSVGLKESLGPGQPAPQPCIVFRRACLGDGVFQDMSWHS